MTERNDGGPAFPHESYDAESDMDTVKPGLSARDWFAGQALAGYLASKNSAVSSPPAPRAAAEYAYRYADAMLAAREASND